MLNTWVYHVHLALTIKAAGQTVGSLRLFRSFAVLAHLNYGLSWDEYVEYFALSRNIMRID